MKNQRLTASAVVFMIALAAGLSAVVLPTRAAFAQTRAKREGAALSAEGMQALRILEKVPYFAVGGIGIAASTSEGEVALRLLLKEKNGPVVLRGLSSTAKPVGKLYALLGLKKIGDLRAVAQIAARLRPYKGRVAVRHGCLYGGEPFGELATKIEKGEIVLPPERIKPPAK